jgi:creatinine amidohydrolase
MSVFKLDELSSNEFGALVKKDPLVFLPLGAVEEHGAHLPLCTDSIQPEYIVGKVAAKLPGTVLIAPAIRYANCVTTRNFPGTISLSVDTLRALIEDILDELCRNGIRRVVIVSGHAGGAHMAALRTAGENVVEDVPELKLMVLSDYDIAYELKGREFDERDGHAGTIETSRVMAIKPKLVKKKGVKSYDRPPRFMVLARPEKHFPTGVMGDASIASPGQGRRINDYIINGLAELVKKNMC